jgi:meso-butanediol dehydrogenase / (S,S)-butanediol dehydrogenase / diacetyl reductase
MPTYALNGQIAIVTGGGGGIGRAISLRLAGDGAGVAVADLSAENARRVADEIAAGGGQALSVAVDVTRKADVERMVQETVAHFGDLHILVNNAGIGLVARLMDTDETAWNAVMDANAKSVLLCSQAAARHMISHGHGGRIINNASGAGKIAPGRDTPLGAYAASKHAAIALTKQMGLELAAHGILVNAVCAGIVDTPMWDLIDREVAAMEGVPIGSVKARAVAGIPVGRIQRPEDVANMVAFLASPEASYITAQALNVCGGILPY